MMLQKGEKEMSEYLKFITNIGIEGAHPGGLALTKKLLANEKITPTSQILDVGCGTGQTAAYITKQYGCQVFALDMEKKMIEKAAKRFYNERLNIPLVIAHSERMPFTSYMFDYVLAESVIAFTQIEKTLQECYRVLKQNGILIAIEMTKQSSLTEEEEKKVVSFYGVTKIMTEQEWCKSIKAAGFHTVNAMNVRNVRKENSIKEATEPAFNHQNLDFHMFRLWIKHQELIIQLRERLSYRVYRAVKKTANCGIN